MTQRHDEGLLLNPTLEIELSVSVRQRNRPLQRFQVRGLSHGIGRLLVNILAGVGSRELLEVDVSDEVLAEALASGVLVRESDVPPRELRYRADLDDETIQLIPTHRRWQRITSCMQTRPRINERIYVQTSEELPARFAQDGLPGERPLGAFSTELPVLWVESPRHRLLTPIWTGGDLGAIAARVVEDPSRIGSLSADVIASLLDAEILLDVGVADCAKESWAANLPELRQKLTHDNYIVLQDLISAVQIGAARKHLRRAYAAGFMSTDVSQVRNMRDGTVQDGLSHFLQCQLRPIIEELVGEPLVPFYAESWRYRPGAYLERHVDYEIISAKKWHMTLAIDASSDFDRRDAWPLFVKSNGHTEAIKLGLGDALLYNGGEIPHWREKMPGKDTLTMCLIQYQVASKATSGSESSSISVNE